MAFLESLPINLPIPGGFEPIPDVKNNKHVQELGKFAVAEYNKEHGERPISFVEVVAAFLQVVSGINYILIIKAHDALPIIVRFYKAFVCEKLDGKIVLTSMEELVLDKP